MAEGMEEPLANTQVIEMLWMVVACEPDHKASRQKVDIVVEYDPSAEFT